MNPFGIILSLYYIYSGIASAEYSVSELISTAEKTVPAFDYESRAIQLLSAMKYPQKRSAKIRKGNLCATFIKWADATSETLVDNMKSSVGFCNWLVIVYNSSNASQDKIRMSLEMQLVDIPVENRSVNIAPWLTVINVPSKDTFQNHMYDLCIHYFRQNIDKSLLRYNQCKLIGDLTGLPYNPCLFSKESQLMFLLDHLPFYEYAWTLDGDMSFQNFSVGKFNRYHRCAFSRPPVVSQPLISESTQFYRYLVRRTWGYTNALASTVGFIELQASYFQASYLEWFIMAFIVPLLSPMYILGSDWGIDEIYCTAAKQYKAIMVSHNASQTDPICAVIVGNMGIHHNDRKTIKKVMGGKTTHLELNYALMHIVHRMFGNFCSGGLRPENDPFHPESNFETSYRVKDDCRY